MIAPNHYKKWDKQARKRILHLATRGKDVDGNRMQAKDIAKAMGRTVQSVRARLYRMGIPMRPSQAGWEEIHRAITALVMDNRTVEEIVKAVKRPMGSVKWSMRKIGLKLTEEGVRRSHQKGYSRYVWRHGVRPSDLLKSKWREQASREYWPLDATPAQMRAMAAIEKTPMSSSEVARVIGVTRMRAYTVLIEPVKLGWVIRQKGHRGKYRLSMSVAEHRMERFKTRVELG